MTLGHPPPGEPKNQKSMNKTNSNAGCPPGGWLGVVLILTKSMETPSHMKIS